MKARSVLHACKHKHYPIRLPLVIFNLLSLEANIPRLKSRSAPQATLACIAEGFSNH